MNCSFCGRPLVSPEPVARYVRKDNETEEVQEETVVCNRKDCILEFFDELKNCGMLDADMWDSIEFFRRIPDE